MRIFLFLLSILHLKMITVFNWSILNDIFYAKKMAKKIDKLRIKSAVIIINQNVAAMAYAHNGIYAHST